MLHSLSDRQEEYEESFNYKILRRIPLVVRCQLRCFNRLTKNITRPANMDWVELISQTALYSIQEIQGAVLGYSFDNEINFIIKNDQNLDSQPWLNNEIQKICSVSASLVTGNFLKSLSNFIHLDLVGDVIFDVEVSARSSLNEIFNYLIWRQNVCHNKAVQEVAEFFLSQKLDRKTTSKLLANRTSQEKLEIISERTSVDFDSFPCSFRRGTTVCKIPTFFPTKNGQELRDKWTINYDLPFFYQEKEKIMYILTFGTEFKEIEELI